MKIGNSNVENSETVVLQDDDVMTRLRATNSHAARNVLKMRMGLINSVHSPTKQQNNGGLSSLHLTLHSRPDHAEPDPKVASPSQSEAAPKVISKPNRLLGTHSMQTKARAFCEQAAGITAIGEALTKSQMLRSTLNRAKLDGILILNLKDLLHHGAITKIEFKEKVRKMMSNM